MLGTKRKIYFSRLWWCVFLIFLFPGAPYGQYDDWIFHQVDNLTDRKYNYYIYKDTQGFVWISSIAGLNRFDGKNVKVYYAKPGDSTSIADNNIHSNFFEDRASNIWFTSNDAIHYYDRQSDHFHKYYLPQKDSTQQKEYQALFLDTLKNELWIRNRDQLSVWSVKSKKMKVALGNFEMARTWQVKKNQDGTIVLLLPNKNGLLIKYFRHDRREIPVEYDAREILLGTKPGAFFYENDNLIWLGTEKGFLKATSNGLVKPLNSDYRSANIGQIVKIVPESTSRLMIATRENGIYLFNKQIESFENQAYTNENDRVFPFKYVIDEMYLDPDKTLWIASPDRGVMFTHLKKKKFQTYLQDNAWGTTESNNVKAITRDTYGRLWCLTDNRVRILDESGAVLKQYDDLLSKHLRFNSTKLFSIFCDQKNQIWIGTQSGLFLYIPFQGPPQKIKLESSDLNIGITNVRQLSDGKILAGTQSAGVFEVAQKDNRYFLRSFSSSIDKQGTYTWIFESQEGQILFCKYGAGISVFQKKDNNYREDTLLGFTNVVHGFAEDRARDKIWIASNMGLFALIHQSGRYTIVKESTFPEQAIINGILLDKQGNLWCSTNHGILKYNPDHDSIRNYSSSEGLQSNVFNFGAYLKSSDGQFVFGGINGINIFDPLKISDINLSVRPRIIEILINDKTDPEIECDETGATNISQANSLVLSYGQNTISFRFSALEYSDPGTTQFQYQLENYDDSLVFNGTDDFVRYANLPPGYYTFKVKASNSDGIWSDHTTQLKIRIRPPWYLTRGFILLMIVLFLLSVYGIYRFRINQIKKKETYLRKEAEYKQKIAESETAVLRLQMKPHFIFNSMNSIHNYIRKNDTDSAGKYLVRFANLMRRILELAERP